MRKKLLITGGSGYLGRHLTARAGETYEVYTTYRSQADQIKAGQPFALDLTDRAAVLGLIDQLKPQAIIHTAANNPGQDERLMMQINAEGSRFVAEGAVTVGARLVQVSSDVVHDGQHAPYADSALPNPLNTYGRSKAAAEANVAAANPQTVIVRTSLIYGLEEIDRGTAGFIKRLKTGQPLVLFNDVVRQPVWIETLIEALLKLTEIEFSGILNIAGHQALTREAFAHRMLAYWQIDTKGLLQSGRAVDIAPATPLDLRLSVNRGEQLLQMTFPGVDEVLAASRS